MTSLSAIIGNERRDENDTRHFLDGGERLGTVMSHFLCALAVVPLATSVISRTNGTALVSTRRLADGFAATNLSALRGAIDVAAIAGATDGHLPIAARAEEEPQGVPNRYQTCRNVKVDKDCDSDDTVGASLESQVESSELLRWEAPLFLLGDLLQRFAVLVQRLGGISNLSERATRAAG